MKLELKKEEEQEYIGYLTMKPKFNHVKMNTNIITLMRMESLRVPDDWRVSKKSEACDKYLRNNGI